MAARKKELSVYLDNVRIGRVLSDNSARLEFTYTPGYQELEGAIPLSMSMPLIQSAYPHNLINAWMWGALPDNEQVLRRWGGRFHVSPNNAFSLLRHVGADCAGAVRFIDEQASEVPPGGDDIRWLDDGEIEQRLAALRENAANTRHISDIGQFSLAGAQAKTALIFENGRWGVPSGATPTNYILKPPSHAALDGHAENEHFCMRLAAEMDIPTARTQVLNFGGEVAIVVARYDRRRDTQGRLRRIHQEDACQAMGYHPAKKYEAEGGPGITDIMKLLNSSSRPEVDRTTFMRAQLFNFLIAGTDAHAKNYSLLLGARGRMRLAPLYDIASFLPYGTTHKAKLAMRIGSKYRLRQIQPRHWRELASSAGFPSAKLMDEYQHMAQHLPGVAQAVAAKCRSEGLSHAILDRLVDGIAEHCSRHRLKLSDGAAATPGGRPG